ncbi:hypothetical protein MASR2M117_11620 [Paludibacter sp.]
MKKLFLNFISLVFVLSANSQIITDVSNHFLQNAGFNENFNYDKNTTGNIKGDIINNIYGWTKESTADYTVAGTFEYGSGATFNGSSSIPNSGHNGSIGGALALSTGWGTTLKYYQKVRLPKGEYMIVSAYYNAGTATVGSSLTGWIADGVTSNNLSTVTSFPIKQWVTDTIRFNISRSTDGIIQTGFKAIEGKGSADNAKILVDYVKLYYIGIDKAELKTTITQAEAVYNSSAIYAEQLLSAINNAKYVDSDPNTDMMTVLTATKHLAETLLEYKLSNASLANPLNMINHIKNPSFETSFDGWENKGFALQTNTVFPYKNGNTYVEKWVNRGSNVPNVSIEQKISNIPNGKYILAVYAGNIQQTGAGSTVNNSSNPQTGAYVFAGITSVSVDTIKQHSLQFIVTNNEVNIGLKADNATGNWITYDNFQLFYIGKTQDSDFADYLRNLVSQLEIWLGKPIQNTVKANIQNVINQTESAINATPLVLADLESAKAAIDAIQSEIKSSLLLYQNLQDAIDYANKLKSWYAEDANKQAILQSAIQSAEASKSNFDLTDAQINKAINDLQNINKSVDKKIYVDSWALGDPTNNNNAWSYQRSKQSRNWIVFWEKGYGDDINSLTCGNFTLNINALLNVAENCFDYYTDSLKFIKRGSSKTDQYKMVIRVRYTTDWEASGSGVAETIGLLTLTAWSANNPGHTVAHEVAHCFQYQVRCDSGGKNNGWRYGFGGEAGNGWWEQCAQWQGFKIYPNQQFTDGRFNGYMNTAHKHILHETPRYDNFFIQDYWVYLHGLDFIGRLWNESQYPEDPVEAYKRINNITQNQFNDEMYMCGARFATWDVPRLKAIGANYFNARPQPAMTKTEDNAWLISPSVCLENYGHNIIKLNAPTSATRVSVYFEGKAGIDGYRKNYVTQAGWRYGFVALLKDGTRVYSDMGSASYLEQPNSAIHFDCPANCDKLWLVVSGAPKSHWQHAWDGNDDNDEQWPYQVKFNNTNRLGSPNMTYSSLLQQNTNDIRINIKAGRLSINKLEYGAYIQIHDITGNKIVNTEIKHTAFNTELQAGVYIVDIRYNNGTYIQKVIVK